MKLLKMNKVFADEKLFVFIMFILFFNVSFSQQTKITSTGAGGAYSIIYPGYFTLAPGQEFTFEANHANPGSATLNVSGTGAIPISKFGTTSLSSGDIISGMMVKVIYDGSRYQLLSASAGSGSSATSWSLTGNSGLNAVTNFIGTNDNVDLIFKTNTTERMRLSNSGFLGIGTTNPQDILHLESSTPNLRVKSSQSNSSFANSSLTFGRDDGVGGFVQTGVLGQLGGGDFLTVGSPYSIMFNTNFSTRMVIANNGNIGINTGSPSEVLDVNGNLKLAYAFMPGNNAGASGEILVSQGPGNPPLWQTGGFLTGGSQNYIPKWTSATTLSSTSLLYDNGFTVGIGTTVAGGTLSVNGNVSVGASYNSTVPPVNGMLVEGKMGVGTPSVGNEVFSVMRPNGVIGGGHSTIYGVRAGTSGGPAGGSNWSSGGVDAAVKGNSFWGNNYSAAIAGYNYMTDYDYSAGVIGSDQGATVWGALAYRGLTSSEIYAGYFTGNTKVTGELDFGSTLRIGGNAGNSGDILQSNGAGPPSWVSATTLNAANRSLSNLIATSINQSLEPNTNNNFNLGSTGNSWSNVFVDGRLYVMDVPWTSISVNNNFIGIGMNESITTGVYNLGVGDRSGGNISTGQRNTAVGNGAGQNFSSTSDNTLIGSMAGGLATTFGNENTFVGVYTGYQSTNSASFNTLLGASAGQGITSGGSNTYVGHQAGYNATTGTNNATLGRFSATNLTTGSNNTFIGTSSGLASAIQRNKSAAIGYNARVDADNAMVLGGTGLDAIFVGINTTVPTERLHVAGNLRLQGAFMPNNAPGVAGQMLVSQGSGASPIWSTPTAYTATNGLNMTGSAIGLGGTLTQNTTVNMNTFSLYLTGTNTSNFGIKTTTPSATLHVHEISGAAQVRLTNGSTGVTSSDGFSISNGGGTAVYLMQQEAADMILSTNSSTNLALKSGGNVGVQTTTPGSALGVYGEASIGATYSGISAPVNGLIVEGNLGVGMTNPGLIGLYQAQSLGTNKKVLGISAITNYLDDAPAVIELKGSSATAGDEIGVIDFINRSSSNQDYNFARIAAKWMGTNPTYAGISFSTRNGATLSERMIIDEAGNVGIATASPAFKLDVTGTAHVSGNLYVGSSGTQYIFGVSGSYLGVNDHWIPNNTNLHDLGTSSWRWRTIYLINTPNVSSDRRFKENIKGLNYGLEEVMKIRPVEYNLISDDKKSKKLGVIAQELQEVIPEAVEASGDSINSLGVHYTDLIPVTIKAIQEQEGKILTSEEKIKALEKELKEIQAKNNKTTEDLLKAKIETEYLKQQLSQSMTEGKVLMKKIVEIEEKLKGESENKIAILQELEAIKAHLGVQSHVDAQKDEKK